jgi:hypothetical protein
MMMATIMMMETAVDDVVVPMGNIQSMQQYGSSAIATIRTHIKIAAEEEVALN